MKKLLGLVLALVLAGCSNMSLSPDSLGNTLLSDAQRTNELFIKYGDPAEQKCALFLNDVLSSV